jgi:hypothetical protein
MIHFLQEVVEFLELLVMQDDVGVPRTDGVKEGQTLLLVGNDAGQCSKDFDVAIPLILRGHQEDHAMDRLPIRGFKGKALSAQSHGSKNGLSFQEFSMGNCQASSYAGGSLPFSQRL